MPLRRASGVRWEPSGFWVFRRYRLDGAGREPAWFAPSRYRRLSAAVEADGATLVLERAGRRLWWTVDGFYWDDEALDAEAVSLWHGTAPGVAMRAWSD